MKRGAQFFPIRKKNNLKLHFLEIVNSDFRKKFIQTIFGITALL